MGGMGSGRWGHHRKKAVVEDCRRIAIGDLVRAALTTPDRAGSLTWSRGDRVIASVGFSVVTADGGSTLRLSYTWTAGGLSPGPPRDVALDVRLVRVPIPRGGGRWLGVCPLTVNGVACGRRVAVLYLAPGSPYPGCRRCHELTYRSRQEHDPRVTRLLRNPGAVHRMARQARLCSITQLGLLLKATAVMDRRLDRDARRFEKKYGRAGRTRPQQTAEPHGEPAP